MNNLYPKLISLGLTALAFLFVYSPPLHAAALLAESGDTQWLYILLGIGLVIGSVPAGYLVRKNLKK